VAMITEELKNTPSSILEILKTIKKRHTLTYELF